MKAHFRVPGALGRFAQLRGHWAIMVIGGQIDAERRGAKVEIPACPCCGGPMRIIERFEGPGSRRYPACKPDGW